MLFFTHWCSKLVRSHPLRFRTLSASTSPPAVGANTSSSTTSTFHDYVEQGDLNQVKQMVEKNQQLVNQGDAGRANTKPLHLASRRGFLELVNYLVKEGADVNARGAWELTPLHYTAVFDQPSITSSLLNHGADPCLKDAKGNTALDHAITEQNEDVATVLKESC